MIDFNDPTTMALLNAGVIDINGNYLIDPVSGQPLQKAAQPDFNKINTDYFAEANAAIAQGGEAAWVGSDRFKEWEKTVLDAVGKTTSVTDAGADLDYLKSKANDPLYGDWFKTLAAAKDSRLDFLNNPLSPYLIPNNGAHTTNTEGQINAGTQDIYNQAQGAYQSLIDFQKQQNDYTSQLAEEIRLQREFAIPRPPEKSGTFVAGGTAQASNAPRVGIPDLLIRY